MTDKDKQKIMKKEIQFARDSSTTLPTKVSPIFKIQVTGQDKKRKDKTAAEFGEALGKKEDSAFKKSLREIVLIN